MNWANYTGIIFKYLVCQNIIFHFAKFREPTLLENQSENAFTTQVKTSHLLYQVSKTDSWKILLLIKKSRLAVVTNKHVQKNGMLSADTYRVFFHEEANQSLLHVCCLQMLNFLQSIYCSQWCVLIETQMLETWNVLGR